MKEGRTVRVKKKCCASRSRCKKCPALWKQLGRLGLAEPVTKRKYRTLTRLKKKHMRMANLR